MQLPIYADPRLLQQLGYPILGTPRAAAPAPTGQRSPTALEANARARAPTGDDWLMDPMTLDRPKAKKKASTDVTDIAGDGDLPQSQSLQDWIRDVVSGGADVLDQGATATGDFVRGAKQGQHGDLAAQLLRRFPDNIDDARNRMGMDPSGVTGIRPEITEGDTGAGALSPLPRPPIPATASAPAPTPASVAPPTAPPSPQSPNSPPIPQISPPSATPAALSSVPPPSAAATEPSMISMIEKALVADPKTSTGAKSDSFLSPDIAMALLSGGANMLTAASQPGATFGGALGAGVQGGVKGFTGSKKARADKEEKAYQRRLDRAKLIASAGESEAKRKDARSRDRATADYRKERNQLTREANEQRSIDARERRELADEKHSAALMGVATKIMENNPGMTFDEALLQVMSRVGGGAPAGGAGPRTEAASGPVIERGGKRYQRTAAGWIELR